LNRPLIALGLVFVAAGLLWPWLRRLPLFHLPGDLSIERPGLRFYVPFTTMLLVSAAISLVLWILRRR
jgi:hypothetical protein